MTQYALPAGTDPQGLTVGPDGNIWLVGYDTGVVDKVTPSGSITSYSLGASSRPVRITTGSDGNLWVTEAGSNQIARITTGGSITQFAVPTASAIAVGDHRGPRRQPLVHRERLGQDRPDHDQRRDHRVFAGELLPAPL